MIACATRQPHLSLQKLEPDRDGWPHSHFPDASSLWRSDSNADPPHNCVIGIVAAEIPAATAPGVQALGPLEDAAVDDAVLPIADHLQGAIAVGTVVSRSDRSNPASSCTRSCTSTTSLRRLKPWQSVGPGAGCEQIQGCLQGFFRYPTACSTQMLGF